MNINQGTVDNLHKVIDRVIDQNSRVVDYWVNEMKVRDFDVEDAGYVDHLLDILKSELRGIVYLRQIQSTLLAGERDQDTLLDAIKNSPLVDDLSVNDLIEAVTI